MHPLLRTSLAFVGFFVPQIAWGHVDDLIESLDVHPPNEVNGPMALEMTIGLLVANEATDFHWLCHEAMTRPSTQLTPVYRRSTNGTILGFLYKIEEGRETNESVYRTEDECTWSTVEGLTGEALADLRFDPTDPNRVLAVTATPGDGVLNGLRISTDGGKTWSVGALNATDRLFRSLVFHPDGQHVWASAVHFATQRGWLYFSSDGGENWTENEVDLSGFDVPPEIHLLTAVPESTDTAWFRITQTLEDQLWRADDGGSTVTQFAQPDTKITSATLMEDDVLWLSLWNQGIASLTGTTLEPIEDSPLSFAIRSNATTLFVATRPLFAGGSGLMTSQDGQTFESVFHISDILAPPECAPETHSAQFCDPLWESLAARLQAIQEPEDTGQDSGTPDTGSPSEPQGCCQSRSKAFVGLWLLPLWFGRRRRDKTQTAHTKEAS